MEGNTMDDHPKKTTDAAADDLDDKLKEARLAMEGTEHAAKREERQRIEKERYETQKKRRAVEEKKWEIENSFTKEEGGLEATAKAYQRLLDEEESLYGKLDALEK